jgi:hypothetical protein
MNFYSLVKFKIKFKISQNFELQSFWFFCINMLQFCEEAGSSSETSHANATSL